VYILVGLWTTLVVQVPCAFVGYFVYTLPIALTTYSFSSVFILLLTFSCYWTLLTWHYPLPATVPFIAITTPVVPSPCACQYIYSPWYTHGCTTIVPRHYHCCCYQLVTFHSYLPFTLPHLYIRLVLCVTHGVCVARITHRGCILGSHTAAHVLHTPSWFFGCSTPLPVRTQRRLPRWLVTRTAAPLY